MSPAALQTLATWIGIAIASGAVAWLLKARKLTNYEDLDARYLKREFRDEFNKDLAGFRNVMQGELADVAREATRAEAQAGLAVRNSETAIMKCTELGQTLKEVHERELGRLAKTMEDQARLLDNIQKQGIIHNTLLRGIASGRPLPMPPEDR